MEPLLLHCCCGPCSTAAIERLIAMDYRVVLFFGNSNIYPASEADRRFESLEKVARHYSLELIRKAPNHRSWLDAVHGFEQEEEGGKRCELCFHYNLAEAKEVAASLGIDAFTTTLTISPHKRSMTIFSVGQSLQGFVPIDFKKQGGFQRSIELAKELDLYRQQYCGCEFSMRRLSKQQQADSHDRHP